MIPNEEIILTIKIKLDPGLLKTLEFEGESVTEWLRDNYIDFLVEEDEGDKWSWEYGTGE